MVVAVAEAAVAGAKRPIALVAGLALAVLAAEQGSAQAPSRLDALIRGSTALTGARSVLDLEADATKRYAIVVGNSDYAAVPDLPNAISDAAAVAEFLRGQGYTVQYHEDLTKRGFEDMLRAAMFDIDKSTEVVLFFAGHGFQIGSENYLVPSDSAFDTVYDVPFETVSLGSLVNIIGARARRQVVILDSCRDNPFAGQAGLTQIGNELRESRTGFASLAAPLNSILIYSTSPGAVALDGAGSNSPFTTALLDAAADNPGAPVKDIFEEVRREVYASTGGRQVPWDSSTLIETVSFGGAPSDAPDAGEAGRTTRGIALASTATTLPGLPEEANAALDVVLDVPFQEDVAIGATLVEALGLPPGSAVTLAKQPDIADVVLEQPSGIQLEALGRPVSGAELDQLVLVGRSVQIPARDLAGPELADTLVVEAGGQSFNVGLNVQANACDYHAGDHLDPDGAGLVRYANEIMPEEALAACEAAVAAEPEVGRFQYQLGRALTALRRTDDARGAFEAARDLGHARAWRALARSVENEALATGGEAQDVAMPEEAQAYLAQGVEAGDPYAYYALGREFMRSGGSADVEIEGYDLMMRALEVGHTFAMNELGYFYLDEDSAYHDPERGLRYLRESAAREDIYGYNNMGLVYARGLGGLDVDYPRAEEYFRLAADGGHPNAPANLARLYQAGHIGGAPDLAAAVRWYDMSLERGDGTAGGTAAYLIATEGIDGYQLHDGAVRAAKAAALRDPGVAEQARQLLAQFPGQALDAAAQSLMVDLGADVTVDGQFGPASDAALAETLAPFDLGAPSGDRVERLVQLARAYWTTSPFRVDLF